MTGAIPDRQIAGNHVEVRKNELLQIVANFGLEERPSPMRLASGAESKFFVDAKQALANGSHLKVACQLIIDLAEAYGVDWNAVGGLTMGADPLAHGVALLTGKSWFTVRLHRKERGSNKLIEAVSMSSDTRVLLIDDVVTTGESIQRAYNAVVSDGAVVEFATTLVDRGTTARKFFEKAGVRYEPLLTYEDLGIPPIEPVLPSAVAS